MQLTLIRLMIFSCVLVLWMVADNVAQAIELNLNMQEARKVLAEGRELMLQANTANEIKDVRKDFAKRTRVGADPEKDPCGTSAILRTKRYRLEAYGHQEAVESKKQKRDIRMPEEFIQKILDMPNLEIEVQLCGDDEYFAEGAKIAFQQGSKTIQPIDVLPADRGRKNPGEGPAYRSRFLARFAYDSFDPNAKTKIVVYYQDGSMIDFDADLSKVK